MKINRYMPTFFLATLLNSVFAQKQHIIRPEKIWADENGNHIQVLRMVYL